MRFVMILLLLFVTSTAIAEVPSDAPDPDIPALVFVPVAVPVPSAIPPPTVKMPSDALRNPGEHPVLAWDDATTARKTSWPLAVWAGLAMIGKALAYGSTRLKDVPFVGKLAAWLATDKHAMWVAGIGAVGAAGYNVMVGGGTLVAALVAAGVAIAGLTHSTIEPAK